MVKCSECKWCTKQDERTSYCFVEDEWIPIEWAEDEKVYCGDYEQELDDNETA